MENHVRIYRENPIAWWDKPVMRYLRHKYGKDKKKFVLVRSVYLALCEIESDFTDRPVNSFTKTIGTYAGVSREVAGKYINLLIKEKLLIKTRTKDPVTNKFAAGTIIKILSIQPDMTSNEPLPGYPSNGVPQRWDTGANIKKISTNKNLSIDKNVIGKSVFKTNNTNAVLEEKIAHYAKLIAAKLGDQKSLTFYKIACQKYDPETLLQKAHAIMADGGAEKPGAVFVAWLKGLQK